MKKYFKLLLILVISFMSCLVIYADDATNVCQSDPDWRPIYIDDMYNPTGWDTYAWVCKWGNCETVYSSCMEGYDTARNWCVGTYQNPGYKGSYHTTTSGKCGESSVCGCYSCSTTCTYKKCKEEEINCDLSDPECICVDQNKVDLNLDPGDSTTLMCKKTVTRCETKTDTVSVNYTSDGCMSSEASSTAESAGKKAAEDACSAPSGYYVESTGTPTCNLTYRIKYPVCQCIPSEYHVQGVREAKYSTVDGIPVYCINPAHEGPSTSGAITYKVDATECASSNSTVDCGYANIMIEGYYRRYHMHKEVYNYAVIGAAMRMWGAYTGQGGYNDTGIADEDNTTIDTNSWLRFTPRKNSSEYDNVFKQTVKSIFNKVYFNGPNNIYEVDSDGEGDSRLKQISCSKDRMGTICSSNTGNYIYALVLFINTVQGNDLMQQHLDEINFKLNPDYDESDSVDPDNIYSTLDKDNGIISVTYKLQEGVELECSTLPDGVVDPDACKVEQTLYVYDKDGNNIGALQRDITEYDYCKKNYCYVDIKYTPGTINCNIIDKVIVKAKTSKKCGEDSVKKYVSCASPSTTQIMFSFEPDTNCSDPDEEPETFYQSFISCDQCTQTIVSTSGNCVTEGVGKNDTKGYVEHMTADPSLNCILHKASGSTNTLSGKNYYNYSDMFNVNTDICKIYCSDKVNYYLASKQEAFDGLQFKIDIKSKVFTDIELTGRPSDNALVGVIQVKRDCVSEIYYNNSFDYIKDWYKTYGLDPSLDIKNWNDLYAALEQKSENENDRQELLNKLIYDLYNCNLYTDQEINTLTSGSIGKPKDSINAYSTALEILDNTNDYCTNGNDCFDGYMKYEGGAEYIAPTNSSKVRVGAVKNDPRLSSELYIENTLERLYCTDDKCFRGTAAGADYPEDYSNATTTPATPTTKEFGNGTVSIPTNDYVIFSYSVEAQYYNADIYQSEPYTGKVQLYDSTSNYVTLPKNTFPVSSYADNLCLSSNNDGNGTDNCEIYYEYDIKAYTKYNSGIKDKLTLFNRNASADAFMNALSQAGDYSCYYKVGNPWCEEEECPCELTNTCPENDELGYVFRNIDLNNPVPNIRTGTDFENSNWDIYNNDSSYAAYLKDVINEIETSGENNLYATEEYLEYSYTLDSSAINSIREYNSNHSYYDNSLSNCQVQDGMYVNCQSSFISELAKGTNSFNVKVNKGDGVSQYTDDKDNDIKDGGGN